MSAQVARFRVTNTESDIAVTHPLTLNSLASASCALADGLKSSNQRGMSQIFPRVSRKFSGIVSIGDK